MDVKIKVNATVSTILRANTLLLGEIANLCSYQKVSERAQKYSSACQNGWDGRVSLVNKFTGEIPTGLVPMVVRWLKSQGHTVELDRNLPKTEASPKFAGISPPETLRSYQLEAIERMVRGKRGILQLPTGSGKCLGIDTPLIMANGQIKMVQDLAVGDLLMGIDSSPREILSTCSGRERLIKIIPNKGDAFVINESHILSLKYKDQIINLPFKEYETKSRNFKHLAKLYRVAVNFPAKNVPLDPYWLGTWLGDGRSNHPTLCNTDTEIISYWENYAFKLGLKLTSYHANNRITTYGLTSYQGDNPVLTTLRDLNLINNKHIPDVFKFNSVEIRQAVLAGLIDTDGHNAGGYVEFTLKSKTLVDDLAYLSRSLGFRAVVTAVTKTCQSFTTPRIYYRMSLSGDFTNLPMLLSRKKPATNPNKSVLVTGFTVEDLGIGDFYGFELSGDRLFLLGDFTVTHNTETAVGVVGTLQRNTIFFVHTKELVAQAKARFERYYPGIKVGTIGDGIIDPGIITIASIQTISSWLIPPVEPTLKKGEFTTTYHARIEKYNKKLEEWTELNERALKFLAKFPVAIFDECHHLAADTFYTCAQACTGAEYLFALSATPFRDDNADLLIEAGSGSPLFSLSLSDVVDMGYLLPAEVHIHDYPPLPPMNMSNSYAEQYKICITTNDARNDKICEIVEQEYAQGHSVLVLCREIEHINLLSERINAKGVPASPVHSKTKNRLGILDDFKAQRIKVLIGSTIFDEGVDIPAVDTIVLAGAGKSKVKSYQRLGRCLRPFPGKTKAIVHDFRDEVKPFYYHSLERFKLYKAERSFKIIDHRCKVERKVVSKTPVTLKILEGFGL